jgi:tartrate dehydratase alpha subunit/fumarate hydratase class I-like protein
MRSSNLVPRALGLGVGGLRQLFLGNSRGEIYSGENTVISLQKKASNKSKLTAQITNEMVEQKRYRTTIIFKGFGQMSSMSPTMPKYLNIYISG